MTTKLKEADVWVGKTVFHPIAIALCHIFRCTQYRLSRDLWFFVIVVMICEKIFYRHISPNFLDWFMLVLFFAIASFRSPDKKSFSSGFGRGFLWLLLLSTIIGYFLNKKLDSFIRDFVLLHVLLLAEYALTIDTLPPKKDKKKKEVYREQFSG